MKTWGSTKKGYSSRGFVHAKKGVPLCNSRTGRMMQSGLIDPFPEVPMLSYPFATPPAPGTLLSVAPGVSWLRMPLPFALNHINLWVLDDTTVENGCVQVDCGIDTVLTRAYWDTLLAGPLAECNVTRVIATHMHPDHLGLAHWLCARHAVPLLMTQGEYAMGRILSGALPGGDSRAALAHFRRHGIMATDTIEKLSERGEYFTRMVPAMPLQFQRLLHGSRIDLGAAQWEVLVGYGHSPEHVALYNAQDNVLISGDMLLPTISTNISVFALEPEGNPLPLFLNSIEDFLDLPEDVLVLPSHGLPFRGAHARVAQLIAHHQERLDQVRAWCVRPQSAAEIVPLMFTRALDVHQTTFALGEALAHLHMLWHAGELRRDLGDDDVFRFVRCQ